LNYSTDLKSNLEKSDYLIFIFLFFIAFISRLMIVGGEYHGYGWDPGNYALATKSYSIFHTRPHWPGYFLHVKIIQIVNYFIQDTFKTIITLSMFYSSLGISFFYLLLKNWFRQKESILITLILMTNPLVWYYGCMEEMYSFEILFSVLLVYLSIKNKLIYVSPILVGLAAGIRPSSAVLLFPLYIYLWYSFYKKDIFSKKYFYLSHITGIIVLMCWFLPLTNSVGGISSYFKMFLTHNPIQQISFFQNLVQFFIYLSYPIFGIIIGLVFMVIQRLFFKARFESKKKLECISSLNQLKKILFFWIIPPILFYIFFHYSKGYILLCTAAITPIISLLFLDEKNKIKMYILIIFMHSIFFLNANYELPNVQTYFNRTERNIDLVDVLYERLGSNYLLSKSSINNMQVEFQIINQIIEDYKNDNTGIYSFNKYVFIDPTITISPRALQYQYPDILFAKISPRMNSAYGILQGIDIERKHDLKEAFSNSIVLSRIDFVDNYLGIISKEQQNYNSWAIFIPNEKDTELLAKLYTRYFVR
jgi:hypothetical protein